MIDGGRPFLDTNVILYALHQSQDAARSAIAKRLFKPGTYISTQVISECVSATQRKFKGDVAASESIWQVLSNRLTVVQVQTATIRLALDVQAATTYSFYDSQLIAAALEGGCTHFFSEDMQHGRVVFGKLTILNPFL